MTDKDLSETVLIFKDPKGRLFWQLVHDCCAGIEGVAPFYSPEYVQSLLGRIAELEGSHKKLRDSVAAIHNTIIMDGVNTHLVGIMNAAKRAFEESKAVSDGSLTVQGD